MTRRGHNRDTIDWRLEDLQVIEKKQFEQNFQTLHRSTFVARTLVTLWKDDYIALFGEEGYNKALEQWSITEIEARDRGKKEDEERIRKEEEKLEIQKKMIILKEKELEIMKIGKEAFRDEIETVKQKVNSELTDREAELTKYISHLKSSIEKNEKFGSEIRNPEIFGQCLFPDQAKAKLQEYETKLKLLTNQKQ